MWPAFSAARFATSQACRVAAGSAANLAAAAVDRLLPLLALRRLGPVARRGTAASRSPSAARPSRPAAPGCPVRACCPGGSWPIGPTMTACTMSCRKPSGELGRVRHLRERAVHAELVDRGCAGDQRRCRCPAARPAGSAWPATSAARTRRPRQPGQLSHDRPERVHGLAQVAPVGGVQADLEAARRCADRRVRDRPVGGAVVQGGDLVAAQAGAVGRVPCRPARTRPRRGRRRPRRRRSRRRAAAPRPRWRRRGHRASRRHRCAGTARAGRPPRASPRRRT